MSPLHSRYDVVVIGSGPGGMAAAIAARQNGAAEVLVIERDVELGGILLQCIHNGFGLELLKQDLPGPAYANHYIRQALALGVQTLLDAMVLEIRPDLSLRVTSRGGLIELQAGAIVLAMGCRERTRPQIALPGTRPAGVYTAGTAQRWVNVEGYMPGERFVILGSGDIGMIMARRLTFEGAIVERVLEIQPYLSGLMRNYVQCLLDYDIPLQLQRTVKRIIGDPRLTAVETVAVDERWQPVPGSEEVIPCDTLLLSVGLVPENELSRQAGVKLDRLTGGPVVDERFQTSVPGIFAAGNVVHVYDLVDWVTEAGFTAGKNAARCALGTLPPVEKSIPLQAGENVRYAVPHTLNPLALTEEEVRLQLRVRQPVEAPVWVEVLAEAGDGTEPLRILRKGEMYARPGEMITVTLTSHHAAALARANALRVNVRPRRGG